jgi:probable rRNA maturation factor
MILIKNTQKKIPIDSAQLTHDAQKILDFLQYADFDLGILITTNATIRHYNRDYRHKDNPTDILSFSYHPNLKAGQRIHPKTPDDKNLGDLIISAERVLHDAQELGVSFQDRLRILLIHGICHLLGYDHELDADYEIMKKEEKRILHHLQKISSI